MPDQPTFNEVLSAAIEDLTANGFDSQERIDRWTRELEAAAKRSLVSEQRLTQMLRDGLARIYSRMVDRDGVLKFNEGVSRFTLANVKPKMRSELDRRILASARLIKLNRQEAIQATLRRFQGWATSIPAGGSGVVDKRETRKVVRKALASLPFRERRVLIDQGHKFTAALSDILARDGGAIAARWSHHYVLYPRHAHVQRDGSVFLIRDSWAHSGGLVKPQRKNGFVDDVEQPGEFVFCRCTYTYLYNLRDLPADMLTAKGKRALDEARSSLQSMAVA